MILGIKRKTAKEEHEPKPSKAKTKHKKSSVELHGESINEIKNDEKDINEQIFKEYFYYHTALFLENDLYSSDQTINDEFVKHYISDVLIELEKDINRKKILKMKILNR